MSKKEKNTAPQEEDPELLFDAVKKQAEAPSEEASTEPVPNAEEVQKLQEGLKEKEDQYLRLLAEYDNYRKRSQKEKEELWVSAKSDTTKEFFPVYDNIERALKQETSDEAYAKGVQMIMTQLQDVLEKLGIAEIPALGQPFDPLVHNAVMHVDDETAGENEVVEVFQTGFKIGDRVVRHAMVKVAN